MINDETFDDIKTFPNDLAKRNFDRLVGLEETKNQLVKMTKLWLRPQTLREWSKKHYKRQLPIVDHFLGLPHLVILEGDVGTGKSTLAESFADMVARDLGKNLTLYRLSMTARGIGVVGDMTNRLSQAFKELRTLASQYTSKSSDPTAGVVFLIDEADAIVQSRELAQMHHEDRAGVNTVIRGISDLADSQLPIMVVLCTNRIGSIDPAVKRRASKTFTFTRPNDDQRRNALIIALEGLEFSETEINQLVSVTGKSDGRDYGFTYSDIFQQFVPSLVIESAPEKAIQFPDALKIAKELQPTPPLGESLLE